MVYKYNSTQITVSVEAILTLKKKIKKNSVCIYINTLIHPLYQISSFYLHYRADNYDTDYGKLLSMPKITFSVYRSHKT